MGKADLTPAAHAYLETNLFSTFECHPEAGEEELLFDISLSSLIEVLNIYAGGMTLRDGSNNGNFAQRDPTKLTGLRLGTTMRMVYKNAGDRLTLIIQEGEIVTECHLTTFEPSHLAEIELVRDPEPHKIIMRSEWLHEALNELTDNGGKIVSIRQSPVKPHFRLTTKGTHGTAQMDYPNDRNVLEVFDCYGEIRNSYNALWLR